MPDLDNYAPCFICPNCPPVAGKRWWQIGDKCVGLDNSAVRTNNRWMIMYVECSKCHETYWFHIGDDMLTTYKGLGVIPKDFK